jgi:hypothetical protein
MIFDAIKTALSHYLPIFSFLLIILAYTLTH